MALGEQLMASLDRQLEFQMLQGIRPLEQRRLVDIGHRMRVYLPMAMTGTGTALDESSRGRAIFGCLGDRWWRGVDDAE
ncbi:proline dehydrogenase [Cutibacterium acnes JCM 18916]|nr:proline dehydrogenase [Cutibacterium acnes JCM 18916]